MLEEILEKILAEVSPGPTGNDPTDHPVYEAISDQRNRGGPFSGSADWKKTQELCLKLLSEVSKELGVMNTLVVAMAHNHGLAGLNAGIKAQLKFCQTYWAGMYPEVTQKKRRVKAMRWLNDSIKTLVKGDQLETQDRALLEEVQNTIKALHEGLTALDAGSAIPSFADVREWIETTLIKLPKTAPPKPDPEPVPAPATPAQPIPAMPAQTQVAAPAPAPAPPAAAVASAAPGTPLAVTQAAAGDASMDEQLAVLAKIAANIHAQAPNLPVTFRLLRMAKWAQAKLPPHEANGETRIPVPNEQIINSLKTMAQRQAWADLLHRCEDLTQRYPYWLDLQYYGSLSAGSLGAAYEEIREVIDTETRVLFGKLPKLAALKFNDGTSMATSATIGWLEGLTRSAGGDGGHEDPAAALRADLLKMGEAKFGEALQMAQEAIDAAPSPLAALKLQLEAAAFALNTNQASMALSILRSLTAQVRGAKLEQWEPKWVARVWSETVKACREVGDRANDELEKAALSALAGLDLSLLAQLKVDDPA